MSSRQLLTALLAFGLLIGCDSGLIDIGVTKGSGLAGSITGFKGWTPTTTIGTVISGWNVGFVLDTQMPACPAGQASNPYDAWLSIQGSQFCPSGTSVASCGKGADSPDAKAELKTR